MASKPLSDYDSDDEDVSGDDLELEERDREVLEEENLLIKPRPNILTNHGLLDGLRHPFSQKHARELEKKAHRRGNSKNKNDSILKYATSGLSRGVSVSNP